MPITTDVPVTVGPWLKFTKELFEFLKMENAAMANMTFAEAAIAMGYKFVSGVGWVKNVTLTSEAVVSASTAAEAIAGTVVTGGVETTTGTIVLTETAAGGASAMGFGTIATGVAAIALTGACGYIIGNGIGEIIDYNFPEFFNGLFSSISESITGTENGLAFLFDSDGHSYMPEASKLAIKEYLNKQINEIKPDSIIYNNIQVNFISAYKDMMYNTGGTVDKPSCQKITSIINTSPVYCFTAYTAHGGLNTTFLSKEPFTLNYTMYKLVDGVMQDVGVYTSEVNYPISYLSKSFYRVSHSGGGKDNAVAIGNYNSVPLNEVNSGFSLDGAVYEILYGNVISGSSMPKISTYELPSKPIIKTQLNTNNEFETWIRIPLPEPSSDSAVLPSTTPILEEEDVEETEKLPKPLPVSDETIVPNPEVDPSTEPDTVTPTPPTPTPPTDDTGSTPTPVSPVIPPLSNSATGLLHVYNPTAEQLNQFGAWLWTTFSSDLIDTLSKLFNNPMDAVIGLHELYCTPITGDTTTIKAGFLDSDVNSRLVAQRYTEINCGAITIPEYWGNYLDYSPYTKVYCYLPFIGIVDLNTDDIIGHAVQIVYKIDSYNGSCIAMIITAKNQNQECVKYQFSGNCSVEVPITSGMKSTIQSALIGAATCAIGVAGGASIVGKATTSSALKSAGIKGAVQGGLNGKESVSHSGTFGSSYGAMGIKKPYFIVRRPIQKVVGNYNIKYGYPAHRMVKIGSCSGYLRCRDFEVLSSTATEEEKKRIEILLKEGVYV